MTLKISVLLMKCTLTNGSKTKYIATLFSALYGSVDLLDQTFSRTMSSRMQSLCKPLSNYDDLIWNTFVYVCNYKKKINWVKLSKTIRKSCDSLWLPNARTHVPFSWCFVVDTFYLSDINAFLISWNSQMCTPKTNLQIKTFINCYIKVSR